MTSTELEHRSVVPPSTGQDVSMDWLAAAVLVMRESDCVTRTDADWSSLTGLWGARSQGNGWLDAVWADDAELLRDAIRDDAAGAFDVRLVCWGHAQAGDVRWTRWLVLGPQVVA